MRPSSARAPREPFASPWGTPVAQLGNREAKIQKVALTGERCDAPPGTIRDGAFVATTDEWLSLKKFSSS
jgi:hypothetical protein